MPQPPDRTPVRGPVGSITRGTTNPNRLRRVDRWLSGPQAWRLTTARDPLVVDLGYGAAPVTAVELFERLRVVRPDVEVIGIEIDPERVRAALPLQRPGLTFRRGGFELPLDGRNAIMVRAFNVLRQYDEGDYAAHWSRVCSRLAPDGIFVDGTCDEIGRRSAWVALTTGGPVSLTISMRFGSFALPSDVAERLPKALIHRNLQGERVHRFLRAMDAAWTASAALTAFGNRQRWIRMCSVLKDDGWPLLDNIRRWRLGELSVAWEAVAPG